MTTPAGTLTPDTMRRLAAKLRQYAATMDDPRRAKKYRRRAAWWDEQAARVEKERHDERDND